MTIEINTFEATYNKPLDGGAFIAAAGKIADVALAKALETLRIYEGVGSRILKERNALVPDSARWDYTQWFGLFLKIDLGIDEGFDALHDYYEYLAFQTKHVRSDATTRKVGPDPEDYAELRRRSWTFYVGDSRCTLAAFANANSNICKMVEVGTQPKYELICAGSPLPERSAA